MRRRLDKVTLAGLLIAMGAVIGGHSIKDGSFGDLFSVTAFVVVMVGSFGAVVVASPYRDVRDGFVGFRHILFPPVEDLAPLRDKMLELAALSRREGLIALEEQLEADGVDAFLQQALGLAVDGSSADALRDTVETDIARRIDEMQGASRFWETWGTICPTIGVLGAVLGLIQVMKGLEHQESPEQMGAGIAVAFVATVYGVGYANLVCLPVAFKLKRMTQRARLRMSMVLEGVIGIQAGVAPGVLRSRLSVYLPEGRRG